MRSKTTRFSKFIGLLLIGILLFSLNVSGVSAGNLLDTPTPTPTGTSFTCTTWKLASDFRISPNENPNSDSCNNPGVWSFMSSGTLPRNPANYYLLPNFHANNGGYNGLYTYDTNTQHPHIDLNASGADLVFGTITYPAGAINVHPAPNEAALIAWHSPINGYVSITGGVSDDDPGSGNGIAWFIDKNSTNLASGVQPNGGAQLFSTGSGGANLISVAVNTSDILYFFIDPRDGNYFFDNTRVDITIGPSGATPTNTATATFTPTRTATIKPTATPTNTFVPGTPHANGIGTCWASGASWPNYDILYKIDSSIPANWNDSIHEAAFAWNAVAPSGFDFRDTSLGGYVIDKGPLEQGFVALTLLYAQDSTLTGLATRFNEAKSWDPSHPPSSTSHSVRNLMTHEFGHWLKLEDISTSGCKDATMWHSVPTGGAGETKKESLETPDINGMNYQYP